ncbi:MAG: CotH kinase family protein [Kiritimatiellae bacterium]|nr:CotH kinase family protein [Kiritimatiellia bacterium]
MAVFPAFAGLEITEICPRPEEADPNGKESGWIELCNNGTDSVDLGDYELQRFNLGKKAGAGAFGKLPSSVLAPGGRVVVYSSEEYDNAKDMGGDGFTVKIYDGVIVLPFKVNPKKFPMVRLLKGDEVLQTEHVPVDLRDGWSYAKRLVMPNATKGSENDATGSIAYGPNIGPLFGVKHKLSVFDPLARPKENEDYAVSIPVNPLDGTAIESVTLNFISGVGASATTNSIAMEKGAVDSKGGAGRYWTATVPAEDLPSAGGLLRLWTTITEEGGAQWRSPSFLNPDDGFQYLGTVVESAELDDAKLQTFHFFVEGASLAQMDVDADDQDLSLVPHNARASVFDSQTGAYYDNVRIDLRGNTSGTFRKKAHGLKFAKCHPLKCVNPMDGEAIEVRKTSFTAEYCDPAYVRQSLAFWLFRKAGCKVPFHYPARLNLNGEFYQLAFHTIRFSDEYIEDYCKLDPRGYGYKNSGCLHWGRSWTDNSEIYNWVACEKKTPDDGDETSWNAYVPLRDWVKSFNAGMEADVDDQPEITKEVVKTFDLPAWLNYLAAARITMETDDTWANLSVYGDVNGTGTWTPLGYDMNQTWGHIYSTMWNGAKPMRLAEEDGFKAHPFFGGRRVLCHFANGDRSHPGGENWACEAIWQSTKFRRMYLRRLRTLMDTMLKAPGTAKSETPVWREAMRIKKATEACAALDYAKWRADRGNLPEGSSGTFWLDTAIYCWDRALSHDEGYDDLWDNYIVPRRRHLFETHSANNASWEAGYGQGLNAGIPEPQSSLAVLAPKLSFVKTGDGVLEISNASDEAVDMSGWKLSGAVEWTLPGGMVVDAHDTAYVVSDRAAYIKANEAHLADELVAGNAKFTSAGTVYVVPASVGNADGTVELGDGGEVWFSGSGPVNGEWSAGLECPLYVDSETADDGVFFSLDPSLATRGKGVSVEMVVKQDTLLDAAELPSVETMGNPVAAVVLASDGDACAFHAFSRDGWTKLSSPGMSPVPGVAYALKVDIDCVNGMFSVSARDGSEWTPLSDGGGKTSFPTVGGRRSFAKVGFCGRGRVDRLDGYETAAPERKKGFFIRIR